MKIKKKRVNTKPEQDLLTGLIISEKFCREIIPLITVRNLKSSYVRRVVKWCIEYYKKYDRPPKKSIKDIFAVKIKEENLSEEDEDYITNFLSGLSFKHEKNKTFDEKLMIDMVEKYLVERKLELFIDEARGNLDLGKVNEVESSISKYTRQRRPESSSVDIIRNKQVVSNALYEDEDVIFRYPGALGHVVGDVVRGDFFSFMAPMKRGKTWWLEDFAIRCFLNKRKVLYVSLEMPLNQILRRFYMNFLGQPRREREIIIPHFTKNNYVKMRKVQKEGLRSKRIVKRIDSLSLAGRGGGIRVLCRPSKSMTVEDLRNEVYDLAHYEGYFPEFIIVDYADILAPEKNSPLDVRHRIDETWARLRGLAQEMNGVIITATQSTRSTFTKDIEEEDTSEDIRKLAHVTQMVVLNQTREEKKNYLMRVGVLVAREEEFQIDHEAMVTYQFSIGKAFLDSRYKKDVIF